MALIMFNIIKKKFQENLKKLLKNTSNLYITGAAKDDLWSMYLNSFPEAERQEFNCNSCRHFIKNYSNVVAIKDNKLVSIWSFDAGDPVYQSVFDKLDALVLSYPIRDIFFSESHKIGIDFNIQLVNGGTTRWEHFYYDLPRKFVHSGPASMDAVRGSFRDNKNVFKRSLDELKTSAVKTVIELIDQNSIYRGAEFKGVLEVFLRSKLEYEKLPEDERDVYCWVNSVTNSGTVSKIRNTAIGTMLIDISEDMDLDKAVGRFEKIMAPTNYKRPTPVVSKKMIEDAEKTIKDLGYLNSLGRKLCKPDDLNINNVFFANRDTKAAQDIFGSLKEDGPINPKKLNKVEEITLEEFINKVIPKASSVELLLENKHTSNLVSLIGPADKDAPSLFKWPNGFSWSYRNALADSLKEKVKSAGGKVEGDLRISLEWFNYNDLDLHLEEPGGNKIAFYQKKSLTGGQLDVDMNMTPTTRSPVENIIYPYGSKIKDGVYNIVVNNYNYRENVTPNFTVEVECQGEVFTFNYNELLTHQRSIRPIEFTYNKNKGVAFKGGTQSSVSSTKVWELDTNKFHKVSMGLYSPNHWDGNKVGNKHIFFALEGAVNTDTNIRGFFNEFLNEDLEKSHKKVFEILANKINVEPSDDKQISGVGFSTTMNNSFICRVTGTFARLLKVNI